MFAGKRTVHSRSIWSFKVHGIQRRWFAQPSASQSVDGLASRTRNIGIIAHIDAGKTTTTERMLYYSGHTRIIGNVDEGSTVTDFLPAERARGITIQSAAITFHWPPEKPTLEPGGPEPHTINLIDTPGHSDFAFEVIRSLRVLDGAVCILDGVAGVEAQTEKVWLQAERHGIPRIIFVNKLDRDGAAFERSVKEVAAKLHTWPALCQIPWFENGTGRFQGVVDLINMKALKWSANGDGKELVQLSLADVDSVEPKLAAEAKVARTALVEVLAERDESLIEEWDRHGGDHLAIPAAAILRSLRTCLLQPNPDIVPVFAGASFRNIGVQPVLDAVVDLLPSPNEVPKAQAQSSAITGTLDEILDGTKPIGSGPSKSKGRQYENVEACALAFKVVNDSRRGVLVYVRVYHGTLKPGSTIYNTNLQVAERVPRLMRMMASDSQEMSAIPAGQIGVIPGLKITRTGDTLISYKGMNPKTGPPAPFNDLQLRPIEVPPPVFFARVEPYSLGEQKTVDEALRILLREDPSLHVSVDEDSGQTHLNGMGELHLEIARDRLINDFKAKAFVGKIEISYRERVTAPASITDSIYEKEILGKLSKAGCSVSVAASDDRDATREPQPRETVVLHEDGNTVETIIFTSEPEATSFRMPPGLTESEVHGALQSGALSALGRGPVYYFRSHGVRVAIKLDIHKHVFGKDTTRGALAAAARQATAQALQKSASIQSSVLIEPVMNVVVSTDEATMGAVMQDIMSARGGQILSIDGEEGSQNIDGEETQQQAQPIDLNRVYAPKDPFAPSSDTVDLAHAYVTNQQRSIRAKIPLREMVGYLKHLRSITAGRGTFIMSVDRFEKMNSAVTRSVLKALSGV